MEFSVPLWHQIILIIKTFHNETETETRLRAAADNGRRVAAAGSAGMHECKRNDERNL